jgi:hypothetical protein
MPNVKGKKYPYTPAGEKEASRARDALNKAGAKSTRQTMPNTTGAGIGERRTLPNTRGAGMGERQTMPNIRQNAIREALKRMRRGIGSKRTR